MIFSAEILLFVIRLLSSLLLLGFMVALFIVIRKELASTVEQVSARHRSHGRLVVVSTNEISQQMEKEYALLPITSIGRAPANTLHLPDDFASNHHALLALRSGRWWLEDRGSRNGTMLNGQLLPGPTVVSAGDIIGVGRVEMKLELD